MKNVTQIPFTPVNGRVLIEELPFKPSKTIECISIDKADRNEGIVIAISPHRLGRKLKRDSKGRVVGWEHTGAKFEHDVKVGDRVFFPGKYVDEDTMTFNGVKFRCIDSWEIMGIMEADQPNGYENPVTGEKLPDQHPLLIHP